ncbi:MAG: helix-turn-helix domain-containing protein [Bacillota bacterium]
MPGDLLPHDRERERMLSSPEELRGTEEWLLEKVVGARQALETDMAFLFVFDQSRNELIAYLSLDRKDEPQWQKIQWKAGEELCELFTNRSPGWEQRVHSILIPMLSKGVFHSSLLRPLPLAVDRRGILGAASSKASFFRKGNMTVLDLIAENIRLHGENHKLENSSHWLVKAIDANIRFHKYLTSQTNTLEVVLKQVFDELKTILDAEGCGVLFYDPERKELILQKPSFGLSDEQFQSYALSTEDAREQKNDEEGIGVAVKVFLTGEPYICHMAEDDHITNKRIARIYGARSSLSVPLVVESQRIGVLHVINKRKGSFTDDDARLLELLVGQLAIVIENARLLRQMEQKNDLLRHSMEIHNRLTRMVLREREMGEIIQRLARLIDRDVIVQDQFFKILGSSLNNEEESLAQTEKTMAGELWQHSGFGKLLEQVMTSRQAVSLPASPPHGLKQSRLIAPITLSNNIFGYVSILENEQRKLGELDYLAIEHAVTVFTLKMMQQKIAYDVAERIKGDFLNDLLNGNYQSSGDMLRRASYLGYDFSRPHQVLYIETRQDDGNPDQQGENLHIPARMARSVFEIVNNFFKNRLPGSMVVNMKDEAIVVIAPYPQQKSFPKPEEVAVTLKDAVKELVPNINVLIGIGRVCNNVLEINNSYQEGHRSIIIARKLNKEDEVVRYDSLGVYKLLFAVRDGEVLQEYAGQLLKPILQYDREKNDILLQTLRNYLLCNCNNQKTADSLFIHLNTLKYRLQKIQDICGLDLNDPEERLNLQLALKVLEIKNI